MRRRPHLLFLPYMIFVLDLSVWFISFLISSEYFRCFLTISGKHLHVSVILLYTFSFSDLSNSILEKTFSHE